MLASEITILQITEHYSLFRFLNTTVRNFGSTDQIRNTYFCTISILSNRTNFYISLKHHFQSHQHYHPNKDRRLTNNSPEFSCFFFFFFNFALPHEIGSRYTIADFRMRTAKQSVAMYRRVCCTKKNLLSVSDADREIPTRG